MLFENMVEMRRTHKYHTPHLVLLCEYYILVHDLYETNGLYFEPEFSNQMSLFSFVMANKKGTEMKRNESERYEKGMGKLENRI